MEKLVLQFKSKGKEVELAMFEPQFQNITPNDIAAIMEAKGKYSYKIITSPPNENFCSLMEVEYADGAKYHYFTEKPANYFSQEWGRTDSMIYKGNAAYSYQYKPWEINTTLFQNDSNLLFEFKIKQSNTSLQGLFDLIHGYEKDKWNKIQNQIMTKNKKVKVLYQDIYLKDALGSLMIINLISSIKNMFLLDIQSLQFNLSAYNNNYNRRNPDTNSITEDWVDSNLRTQFLKDASKKILEIDPEIREQGFLPHWRELVFISDDFELIIRPNGGIKNGWRIQGYVNNNNLNYFNDIKLWNSSQQDGILYNIVFSKK
jgi:hypothetical protein